jgi:hydroxyacylglutathione hydrolase
MQEEIRTIRLALPFRLGSVNCYLIETDAGYVLIDTGPSQRRAQVHEELAHAGCAPGELQLILLTHGDFDHTGNGAYLRETFGAKVCMHRDDSGMAERGDMFSNRRKGNRLIRMLAPVFFGFGTAERFEPDFFLQDGDVLAEYGFDAHVLSIPGHSKGSVAVLTAVGELFCGDLMEDGDKPALNSIMDDPTAADASVEKLKGYPIRTVYPGHGDPFPMELFLQYHSSGE